MPKYLFIVTGKSSRKTFQLFQQRIAIKKNKNKCYSTELFGFFWTLSVVWYVEVLQKTTTFRRLELSPSSGEWGRVDLLGPVRKS
jgi:hypothetical protein